MTHDLAVEKLAQAMVKPGTVVTWLNHWSIQHANWNALAETTSIGFDGTLLQIVLNRNGYAIGRTSADLVLPVLFNEMLEAGKNIVLIGAAPGVAEKAAERITRHTVFAFNGFDDLAEIRKNPTRIGITAPDVIVLGLGALLQDEVAIEMHQAFPDAIVCTAGGWIDQFAKNEQYFPPWVHRYRLGWAWRIAHEPRRLLRRYTIDAVAFVLRHRRYLAKLAELNRIATRYSLDKTDL
ncbi:Glycosyl transferase WecB/TagA/CpsF family [Corynebacterium mustelae]|uniref:Glycosyl transferase WecB/TagA/CpsF family n=1 Tax=Corynebacterium mustelae TaxID=571915 RepID=A0A0G3GZ48_9CORY|nr:WecB/TagA/CpsF family glycosyltransferase [Corynebacterium mustelae]AKK04823.1 Glycosyl transferase WecB/TagA/CpsF family [Corynebacterium mustelae]